MASRPVRNGIAILWLLTFVACVAPPADDGVLTIAIVGDSNTWPGWPPPDGHSRWGQFLSARAVTPAGGTRRPLVLRGVSVDPADYTFAACTHPLLGGGLDNARRLLAPGDVDVLVIALGTNDLKYGTMPAATVDCLRKIVTLAHDAGARSLVATVPPIHDPTVDAALVPTTNALIRAWFPARDVIDFDSGFRARLYLDHVHLNDAGQRLRARRAAEALRR
jgi:lysophospholipase L1-like esterase